MSVRDPNPTRREAMRAGLHAGGAALGAAVAPALLAPRPAFAAPASDADVLAAALRLENTAVALYAAAAANPTLSAQFRRSVGLFRRQEAEHAAALSAALKGLGRTPPTDAGATVPARVRGARGQQEVARVALGLESMLVATYHDAAQKLSPRLLATTAPIMADEGQHLVVLRQALSRDPVPQAFEKGSRAG